MHQGEDMLMGCCAVVGAHGFGQNDQAGVETHKQKLESLLEHQLHYHRNCAILFLASYQTNAIKAALESGFEKVREFPNGNSQYYVGVYMRVLWTDREAAEKSREEHGARSRYYRARMDDGDEGTFNL